MEDSWIERAIYDRDINYASAPSDAAETANLLHGSAGHL